MSAFLDSNVLVRHLTGDPPNQAKCATEFLRGGEDLILVDLVVAEVVYVLESVYEVERERVAELLRAIIGFPTLAVVEEVLLLRALEIYEQYRIHFAEAYLAACAELSGIGVASFEGCFRRRASRRCVTRPRPCRPGGRGAQLDPQASRSWAFSARSCRSSTPRGSSTRQGYIGPACGPCGVSFV